MAVQGDGRPHRGGQGIGGGGIGDLVADRSGEPLPGAAAGSSAQLEELRSGKEEQGQQRQKQGQVCRPRVQAFFLTFKDVLEELKP